MNSIFQQVALFGHVCPLLKPVHKFSGKAVIMNFILGQNI